MIPHDKLLRLSAILWLDLLRGADIVGRAVVVFYVDGDIDDHASPKEAVAVGTHAAARAKTQLDEDRRAGFST